MACWTARAWGILLLCLTCCAYSATARSFALGFNGTGRIGRRLQQLPKPGSYQMFLTGDLQAATLNSDPSCSATATCGGTLTVNNQVVIVPMNMMVMLPANALTWHELFTTGLGSGTVTNLALKDTPATTFSVSVTANKVGHQIIAGLIDLSGNPLFAAAGYVDAINYATGELTIETDSGAVKVRINDPYGRYGKNNTERGAGLFDERFCVDPDNPTIRSATGFPMCIPRVDPTSTQFDTLCPPGNRPVDSTGTPVPSFTMKDPLLKAWDLDATKMAPIMVGDYVSFAGIKAPDFIAAWEIVNNVAIYTAPNTNPAYVVFEDALIGTGGLNVLGAGEAAVRSRWEGFTTDYTRPVRLYGLDFNPVDGTYTKREYGQVMPDPGPANNGAVQGRWRFRPPCTNAPGRDLKIGDPYLGNKGCTVPPLGVYTPPTREVMIEIMGCATVPGTANGIASGGCTYRNPTIEYIWPENIPGTPVVENNFNAIPFLTKGGYTSGGGKIVGALSPWPSNALPQNSCLQPTSKTGTPYSVTSGGYVTVAVDVSGPGTTGASYLWTPDAAAGGTCSPADVTTSTDPSGAAVYTATTTCGPVMGSSMVASTTYTVTITNSCGQKFTEQATVNILTAATPAIQAIPPLTVNSGASNVAITAWLSDNTTTSTFTWTPPSNAPISTQSTNPAASSTVTFNAPVIPLGTLTPTSLVFSVTAKNGMQASDAVSAVVTVSPPKDTVTISAVAFRCDKHRMTVTATTSVNDPNFKLYLQPYTDNQGKYFDPSSLGTTMTYGLVGAVATYTITIEPVPLPSMTAPSLSVKSQLGGSASHQIVASEVKPASSGGAICTI